MQVSAAPAILAPQSTGHPFSLPADTLKTSTRIPPLKPAGDSVADSSLQNRAGPGFARPRDKEPAAPPSALQIEIEAMLAEQAEELAATRAQQDNSGPSGAFVALRP